MLNIVVPMAGRGSRFTKEGYQTPKPLIPIHQKKPMIGVIINNIRPACAHHFIFICLAEHIQNHQMDKALRTFAPSCEIVPVHSVTEGAACTILLARDWINNDNPLMIANSDQWVDCDINVYLSSMIESGDEGWMMTMRAKDPKWSFVRLNEERKVVEVVEKKVVSNEATVGIYNYKKGSYFVEAAEEMIAKNLKVNNEFYVAPAYNQMIKKGCRVGIYNVGLDGNGMYGLGIPTDLKKFESLPISWKAIDF